MRKKQVNTFFDGPWLEKVSLSFLPSVDCTRYPFSLPIIRNLKKIVFPSQVTFFIGENGSGKSTILEAIAHHAGFGAEGGSKNISFKTSAETIYAGTKALADSMTLSWRQKPKDGYFFRAESFYNVINYLDRIDCEVGGAYMPYGGTSLHEQSHGEGFFSFFLNRIGEGGFFILDEPEAALSPQRQLSLLIIINQLCKHSNTQFIIATHSPILLAYPRSTIYSCDGEILAKVAYHDTCHYQITKDFLQEPEIYLKNLFANE